MIELLVKAVLSYLLGSLVGSLIVGRLRGGVDIRTLGSGNAGGTNALRTQGKSFALAVMVIDVGKGFLATRAIPQLDLAFLPAASSLWRDWIPAICGIAAVIGHVYPLCYGFRGGKGAATLVGALLGIDLWLLVPVLLTWLIVVVVFGFVSAGSMAAALSVPLIVLWSGMEPMEPLLTFGGVIALLVLFTHRSNIARIVGGTEPRARSLWLFGRGRA